MTYFAKVLLFLSSYAPLLLLIGIKEFVNHPHLSGWSLIIMAALVVIFLGIYFVLRTHNTLSIKVSEVQNKETEVMTYIVTYFPAFLSVNYNSMPDVLALLVLYAILGFLYLRYNFITIHPMFALMGYRLFEVQTDQGNTVIVLTEKERIRRNDTLRIHGFILGTIGLEVR